MKTDIFLMIFFAAALIGGCMITTTDRLKFEVCIKADKEYIDGNCIAKRP